MHQEPILEPVSVRCDMKRAVSYQQLVNINLYRELLACEADVAVDTVLLNVGQKDLATMLAVWTDNLSEGHYIGTTFLSVYLCLICFREYRHQYQTKTSLTRDLMFSLVLEGFSRVGVTSLTSTLMMRIV